jgi:hypothetical protein
MTPAVTRVAAVANAVVVVLFFNVVHSCIVCIIRRAGCTAVSQSRRVERAMVFLWNPHGVIAILRDSSTPVLQCHTRFMFTARVRDFPEQPQR